MKAYISKIEKGELGDVAGLSKDFEWLDIGMFSVITGRNGSGKSSLLEKIDAKYSLKKVRNEKKNPRFSIRFVDNKYKVLQQTDSKEICLNNLEKDWRNFELCEKDENREMSMIGGDPIKNIELLIAKQFIQKRKEVADKRDQAFETYTTDSLKTEKEPCDEINDFFAECGLSVKLHKKVLRDKIEFVKQDVDGEKVVQLDRLSSGEQLIYALALWRYGSEDGKKTQILLIDEFDAHLNPCLMKNFIDLLRRYFVDKGVQVIMTTHSPTTVQYASQRYFGDDRVERDGAKIIWMEDGEIVDEKDKTTQEIIGELSSGLISLHNLEEGSQELISKSSKKILFLEGKTDKIYLKSALKILDENPKLNSDDFYFFNCGGVDNVPFWTNLPMSTEKKVALFDNDKQGRGSKLKVEAHNKKPRGGGGSTKCIFVKEDLVENEEFVIENLFDESFLKNCGVGILKVDGKVSKTTSTKNRFANLVSKKVEEAIKSGDVTEMAHAKEIFKNFEPLLSHILQAFGTETKKS